MPKDKKNDSKNEIDNIIAKGRENIQNRHETREKLLESIAESFNDLGLGINAIQIGDEKFNLKEKSKKLSSAAKEEEYFTEILNTGGSLFVLTVHNDFTGYTDKPFCSKQKIETLIDVELVKNLAPTARIYSPKDKKPWGNIIERDSFEIFISDYQELVTLWENIKVWVKLDWHDDIMKKKKSPHKAENIFLIELFHNFAPDLSWRYAQVKNAEKKEEKAAFQGDWDSLAQQELKKTISSLLNLEDHPIFGENISNMIEEIKPLLAQSMTGKKVAEQAQKERSKAEKHLHKGFQLTQVDWKDWKNEVPIINVANNRKKKI